MSKAMPKAQRKINAEKNSPAMQYRRSAKKDSPAIPVSSDTGACLLRRFTSRRDRSAANRTMARESARRGGRRVTVKAWSRRHEALSVLLCAVLLAGAARYETTPLLATFIQPVEGLDGEHAASFRKGSGIFRQAWVIGPSQDHPDFIGLGPLYNRLSCIACHVKNGRGAAPDRENGVARTMAARLSVEGKDAHGGPRVHPEYGAQLNPEGVPGVAGEGQAVVEYAEFDVALSDGATVRLRRPTLSFRNLAYGPLGPETKTSLRNAPPVFSWVCSGLVRAVLAPSRTSFVSSVETGQNARRFGLEPISQISSSNVTPSKRGSPRRCFLSRTHAVSAMPSRRFDAGIDRRPARRGRQLHPRACPSSAPQSREPTRQGRRSSVP
jgi:hypothetical protein